MRTKEEFVKKEDLVLQIVRYGLPLVVLVFYVTASLGFDYTADNTFVTLRYARDGVAATDSAQEPAGGIAGTPTPLWVFLLFLGTVAHLDVLLASKVLGLFFSCLVILCTYLVAYEVLADRLIAFCIALVLAVQSWFLQIAVSGSAMPLAMTLSLAALFFLLRNEYMLASLLAGLSALVVWQAVGLLPALLIDAYVNSVNKRRAFKVMVSAVLVYFTALTPWILYAVWHRVRPTPVLYSPGELPGMFAGGTSLIVLAVAMIFGIIRLLKSQSRGLLWVRAQIAPLLWMGWLGLTAFRGGMELVFMAVPLLIVYAFHGFREVLQLSTRPVQAYTWIFIVTGLLIVENQFAFNLRARPAMQLSTVRAGELMTIARWLRANTPAGAVVSAEHPGVLGFYSGRNVTSPGDIPDPDYVVSPGIPVGGFTMVYRPAHLPGADQGVEDHFAVWKRR